MQTIFTSCSRFSTMCRWCVFIYCGPLGISLRGTHLVMCFHHSEDRKRARVQRHHSRLLPASDTPFVKESHVVIANFRMGGKEQSCLMHPQGRRAETSTDTPDDNHRGKWKCLYGPRLCRVACISPQFATKPLPFYL